MSKILQIIDELEDFIDSCRFQPLSNTKIVMNKDEIRDYISDLRQNVPEEVRRYQKIIANRDAILRDAQEKAEEMIRKANEMTSTLVSEHEIMQQAFREANIVIENATEQANNIIEKANTEANDIRISAVQYTDDSLGNIQNILSSAIEGMTVKYDAVMRSLESSLDVATKDRQSLRDFFSKPGNMNNSISDDDYDDIHVDYDQTPVSGYVENAFVPEPQDPSDDYGNLTLEDVLNDEDQDIDNVSENDQNTETGEITDFDLDFDDINQ